MFAIRHHLQQIAGEQRAAAVASFRPVHNRSAVEVAAGRVPVLSGLAEITLDTAKAHAKLYQSYGAQGLMVFPSLGYKTDKGLVFAGRSKLVIKPKAQ